MQAKATKVVNANNVFVNYEESEATHTYMLQGFVQNDLEAGTELEAALNAAEFGWGKFAVENYMDGRCCITYTCSSMYDEANTEFAFDLGEKIQAFF
jgi:hypothetical protein